MESSLTQEQVDHPATPEMVLPRPAVREDVIVRAPGLFEGISEDGHETKLSPVINRSGKFHHSG